MISLVWCLWLNFKHVAHVKFQSYGNWEMKSLHVRSMVTKPVYIDHHNLWIWSHYEYRLWRFFKSTFRLRFFIIIKYAIFLDLSWILHLPNLWHASWLVLIFILALCSITIFHGFYNFLCKYDMSKCVEIVILLFLLLGLAFALVYYFDL